MEESIFAKIIARKVPAKIEYEDDSYIVIHDIKPAAPVHVLVIPKRQIPSLNDITAEDAKLEGGRYLVVKNVMKKLGQSDYRTRFNYVAMARQTVFHLHLHVLARGDL